MGARHLHPCAPQEAFQGQFHDFLRSANDQVPGPTLVEAFDFAEDLLRLGKIGASHFLVGHSSITSPGRKSGFRSQ
jgi:indole-3-glycerol phosphate synthase